MLTAQCDLKRQSEVVYITCLDEQIKQTERTRKVWLNSINTKLEKKQNTSGNTQPLTLFNRSLKQYDDYVESNCRFRYLINMPSTNKAIIAFKNCQLQALAAHTESLKLIN